jgi:hypothetical protein
MNMKNQWSVVSGQTKLFPTDAFGKCTASQAMEKPTNVGTAVEERRFSCRVVRNDRWL